ncbi:hypothetical protein RMATCC62417_18582 [Rhizopus microsporus]|nr:hypothetical protein RMATCC62417_18582 [Rhizopus microsporus]
MSLNELHQEGFVRKCKLSSVLNSNYFGMRQLLLIVAGEYTVLRRDAMNLAYFLICKSLEPKETEDYVLKSITMEQFWSHMYKRASSTPTEET